MVGWSRWGRRLTAAAAAGALLTATYGVTAGAAPQAGPAVVAGSVEDELTKVFHTELGMRPGRMARGVKVGRSSGDGLQLGTSRWSKSLAVDLPGRSARASELRGSAVFHDVAEETSLVVQAVDVSATPQLKAGVRTLITIDSPTAPSEYRFPLDVPSGARPQLLDDGSVAVTDRDGKVLGMFASPWAVDASGQSLPTRYELTAEGIVQHIDHRGAAYPVVADPVWFLPLVIVGVRTMVPIVVKAATKAAAKKAAAKAAKAAAKKAGSSVKSVGGVTNIKYYTAGGHRIRPGVRDKTGLKSFAAFKKKYGNRKDYDWHHIVEQKHTTRGKKFGAKSIHNKNNLAQVPREIHQKCINSLMGTKIQASYSAAPYRMVAGTQVWHGQTLRQAVDGLGSYKLMHEAGVRLLRHCGVPI